jgi:hypothetical protein
MAAPTALLTTLLLLALVFWLADAARALIPYKQALWARYGPFLGLYGAALVVNVSALSLLLVRALGLKSAGRKLAHLDQELRADSAIGSELARLEDPFRDDT